jgi:hypothetical protein
MRDDGRVDGDILDTIDGALSDYFVSKDAMRWNPEAGETEAQCSNSADFSLAMLPPWEPFGDLSIYGAAMTPDIASIREGHVIDVDRNLWRVTRVTEGPDGLTFDLEAYAVPAS